MAVIAKVYIVLHDNCKVCGRDVNEAVLAENEETEDYERICGDCLLHIVKHYRLLVIGIERLTEEEGE